MKRYIELIEVLNELDLDIRLKMDLVRDFDKFGIKLDICSTCLDFTVGGFTDGSDTYCSYECLEYASESDIIEAVKFKDESVKMFDVLRCCWDSRQSG